MFEWVSESYDTWIASKGSKESSNEFGNRAWKAHTAKRRYERGEALRNISKEVRIFLGLKPKPLSEK